ncbi:MAG: CTP synthase (glutamine hydrolyzing) [Candidatus Nanohaloarchaea archaeon]
MEFYNPTPDDYKKGDTKFIVVTGSVMSGVGKGTFTSSLAALLQFYGLDVSAIKFDGYLNVDAGTLSPYRHGEVFVLEDGTETDLDLGSYERALHRNLSKDNYLTGGKIFKRIIDKEREGGYLGRDVQFLPHVTGEIKKFIRDLSIKDDPDVLVIEVGGTVGDIENSYFIEAMRQLRHEEGEENVSFVNVTYIAKPESLGEQKSKAAQLGLKKLMSMGVKPDIVVCRCKEEVKRSIKEKVSVVTNLPVKNIVSLRDFMNIYSVPFYLEKQNLHERMLSELGLETGKETKFRKKWKKMVDQFGNPKQETTIAITGKYTGVQDSYISILNALEHVEALLETDVNLKWIETTDLTENEVEEELQEVDGVLVPGGFGSRGTEGKIKCINYARENDIPFLGLCYGFQLAVIEFARNVGGLKKAHSTEIEENTKQPVIDLLPEQKEIDEKGGTMRLGSHKVEIEKDTQAYKAYGKKEVNERFRHRYEVNPNYIQKLESDGLVFSGQAKEDERVMQILEWPEHPFFMATQFHPEFTSKPLNPNPMFIEFLKSCNEVSENKSLEANRESEKAKKPVAPEQK